MERGYDSGDWGIDVCVICNDVVLLVKSDIGSVCFYLPVFIAGGDWWVHREVRTVGDEEDARPGVDNSSERGHDTSVPATPGTETTPLLGFDRDRPGSN